ncbi:hypothetical protein CR152_13630 [Massilia violaceinigra]|uniref:Uncharacterized protein n=1 Tax=Massilia violaceinigra TaxID=2045208 RepID=A0A2D2DKD2_9BURK|nr:hypothetical protein [Massilia violaceinigra]ATQ75444.1 hypothetical protein CR152_13630 [Massilia violaceinigra]
MNLQDQVIYRCIDAACARPMPRRVDFCPYCGAPQHDGARRPAPAGAGVPAPASAAPVAAAPAPPLDAPSFVQEVPVAPPAPPRPAPAAPARKSAPRPAPAPGTGLRKPIRLRYWLMALALLAVIWFTAKPEPKRIEARISEATELAEKCKIKEAQDEVVALRADKVSAAQLRRLQSSINAAADACERKHPRAVKPKAAPRTEPAAASPRPAPRPVERPLDPSARNLIAEAERQIAQGDYRAAAAKLETCIAMVEGGSRECAAFKKYANRLLREMENCVAAGRYWANGRCT